MLPAIRSSISISEIVRNAHQIEERIQRRDAAAENAKEREQQAAAFDIVYSLSAPRLSRPKRATGLAAGERPHYRGGIKARFCPSCSHREEACACG